MWLNTVEESDAQCTLTTAHKFACWIQVAYNNEQWARKITKNHKQCLFEQVSLLFIVKTHNFLRVVLWLAAMITLLMKTDVVYQVLSFNYVAIQNVK